jgi:hypothetical protein
MSKTFGTAFNDLPLLKRSQNSCFMKEFESIKERLLPGESKQYRLPLIMTPANKLNPVFYDAGTCEVLISRYGNFPKLI